MKDLIFDLLIILAIIFVGGLSIFLEEHHAYRKEKYSGESFKEYKQRMKSRKY